MILIFLIFGVYLYCEITFYWGHRFLHWQGIGGLSEAHHRGHHSLYVRGRFISEEYIHPPFREDGTLATLIVAPPIFAVLAVFLVYVMDASLLELMLAAAVTILYLVLTNYLHIQMHLKNSRWKKYGFFRNHRKLHVVHHMTDAVNSRGTECQNFGVLLHWPDLLFGTYATKLDLDQVRPKQSRDKIA